MLHQLTQEQINDWREENRIFPVRDIKMTFFAIMPYDHPDYGTYLTGSELICYMADIADDRTMWEIGRLSCGDSFRFKAALKGGFVTAAMLDKLIGTMAVFQAPSIDELPMDCTGVLHPALFTSDEVSYKGDYLYAYDSTEGTFSLVNVGHVMTPYGEMLMDTDRMDTVLFLGDTEAVSAEFTNYNTETFTVTGHEIVETYDVVPEDTIELIGILPVEGSERERAVLITDAELIYNKACGQTTVVYNNQDYEKIYIYIDYK